MHLFLILEWFDKAVNTLKYPQTAIIPWCSSQHYSQCVYHPAQVQNSFSIHSQKCIFSYTHTYTQIYTTNKYAFFRHTEFVNTEWDSNLQGKKLHMPAYSRMYSFKTLLVCVINMLMNIPFIQEVSLKSTELLL